MIQSLKTHISIVRICKKKKKLISFKTIVDEENSIFLKKNLFLFDCPYVFLQNGYMKR